MTIGAILISFLYALLYCAIIILIAFLFLTGLRYVGIGLDPEVEKWGKVVVGLLCLIVLLSWLLHALGMIASPFPFRLAP